MYGFRGDSTHMDVSSPVNFKQPGRIFWGDIGPGILRSLVAMQALLLTSQKLLWLLNFP